MCALLYSNAPRCRDGCASECPSQGPARQAAALPVLLRREGRTDLVTG